MQRVWPWALRSLHQKREPETWWMAPSTGEGLLCHWLESHYGDLTICKKNIWNCTTNELHSEGAIFAKAWRSYLCKGDGSRNCTIQTAVFQKIIPNLFQQLRQKKVICVIDMTIINTLSGNIGDVWGVRRQLLESPAGFPAQSSRGRYPSGSCKMNRNTGRSRCPSPRRWWRSTKKSGRRSTHDPLNEWLRPKPGRSGG